MIFFFDNCTSHPCYDQLEIIVADVIIHVSTSLYVVAEITGITPACEKSLVMAVCPR